MESPAQSPSSSHLPQDAASQPVVARELAIIVPTYCEAANLPILVGRIERVFKDLPQRHEVVVVDDNSQDGTPEVVAALQNAGYRVRLIVRPNERGLSSAVVRGFQEASPTADVFVCMDADLSHQPEALPALVAALDDPGTDFALGSRYVEGASVYEGWTVFRYLNSKAATLLAAPFTGVRDPMSGFFALRAETFRKAAALNPCGYKIALELIVKCGCKSVREVPIHFANREHGVSKLNLREQFNYVRHVRRLMQFKYRTWAELVDFVTVGASGMVIDLLGYTLLLTLGLRLEAARAVAIMGAMTWNWWFNRCLTFGHTRQHNRPLPQYLRYLLSNALGAAVSWSVSVGTTHLLDLHAEGLPAKLGAALAGIACGTVFNFLLSKFWVYKHRTAQDR